MNFTLNVLGTASALPTTERYPSAQVLNVRGRLFMIDCGEGAQIQLRRAGVSFLRLEHICLSHVHGDHIFGLFGLLSTMGMLGRTAPLAIYAPASLAPTLEFFKTNFGEGLLYEIRHIVLEMSSPEIVYENRNVELLAFPLNHRVETFGFLLREKMPQKFGRNQRLPGPPRRRTQRIHHKGRDSSACHRPEGRPREGSGASVRACNMRNLP